MSYKTLLALGLGALASLAFARPAEACSCAAVTVDQAMLTATAVFEGVVREQGLDPQQRLRHVARFEVSRRWKGDITASQVLRINSNNSCANSYANGQNIVMFAHQRDGLLWDGPSCLPLVQSPPETALLAALGPGMAPLPNTGPPETFADPNAPVEGGCQIARGASPVGALGGFALVLLTAVACRMRTARLPARPPS